MQHFLRKINHKVIFARPYFDSVSEINPSASTCYQISHTHTTLSASVSSAWALVGRIAYQWCAGGVWGMLCNLCLELSPSCLKIDLNF